MRSSWAQPSLSRDFALLAAAILFVLSLISVWITYITYDRHAAHIAADLEQEAVRIERTLAIEIENADFMLSALGTQIVITEDRDLTKLAQKLKSFDRRGYIYSILSWITPDMNLVVSSNKGVLGKPVDISDRDYVRKAMAEPWKLHIGKPIEGRVSEQWVIPVSMGLTDATGRFIGTVMLSIDIHQLTERLKRLMRRDGISFAIVSKSLIPLTQVAEEKDFIGTHFLAHKLTGNGIDGKPSGLIKEGSLFWGTGSYSFYRVSPDYPYIILLSYDTHYSDETLRRQLWSRLVQIAGIALFFVLFLWMIRARMVHPVIHITQAAASVAKGEPPPRLPAGGPVEIENLAAQIYRIDDYIQETKRIEDELRNKLFLLKKNKEQAEMDKRGKSEFLAYVCQEMREPLSNVIGLAQLMKDQLYGPIENRKYREYIGDIYQSSNALLARLHDLLTLAKIETGYIELSEKPVDLPQAIQKALEFVSDRMLGQSGARITLAEPLPRLIADEFRLQQILTNLMLHALDHMPPEGMLSIDVKMIGENRERLILAIVLGTHKEQSYSAEELLALAAGLASPSPAPLRPTGEMNEKVDLNLELARTLVALHHGLLDVSTSPDGVQIVVIFDASRIRFIDGE